MSTVHDTTNLKPYKVRTLPVLEESVAVFVPRELQSVSVTLAQCIVALKALEARLVAGGL